ncbi:Hypothetical predicted protein, partial [Lynx pardinus]
VPPDHSDSSRTKGPCCSISQPDQLLAPDCVSDESGFKPTVAKAGVITCLEAGERRPERVG